MYWEEKLEEFLYVHTVTALGFLLLRVYDLYCCHTAADRQPKVMYIQVIYAKKIGQKI
jgi:hypothetical protein